MQDFRNLKVWHKAHQLTLRTYIDTRRFPVDERFGLTSQMRRAAASIGANIAEGCGRNGDAELSRFLQIAMGSTSELEYNALLARDLEFLSAAEYIKFEAQICELKKMLSSFISNIRPRSSKAERLSN